VSSLEDRVALPALLDPYNQAQLGLALADALRACGYPDTLSCLLRRRGRGSMTVVGHGLRPSGSARRPWVCTPLSIPSVVETLSKPKNKKQNDNS